MIQSKELSLQYWAEAINYANDIFNRTPTKVLQDITLEEAWSKVKLDVSHFRVFGCEAWAHIPDEKWKALQPKSEKCIFVGYFEDVKGYRLLQPHSHDIIIRSVLNLMKISWTASLTWWVCHLWPASLIRRLCLLLLLLLASLIGFQLQFLIMTVRMKIHLHLLMFLQLHQHQYFLDGSVQHVKQLVILPVILEINVKHVLSFSEPLLFWLKFLRIMI